MVVASLFGSRRNSDDNTQPASIIIEKENELKQILPDGKSIISITDNANSLLWQSKIPIKGMTYSNPVTKKIVFAWNGKKFQWTIHVYLPVNSAENIIKPKVVKTHLSNNPQFKRLVSDKYTVNVKNSAGETILTLPEDAFAIRRAENTAMNTWQEIDSGIYDDNRMLYLTKKQINDKLKLVVVAQAIVLEKNNFRWLAGHIFSSPKLFIMLVGLIFFVCIPLIVSILKNNKNTIKKTTPIVPNQQIRLVRKGHREIPDDVDMILAEVGKGSEVEVRALSGVKYPAPDRESNLKRIREIYFHGRDSIKLESIAKSEVLRGLLREVGRREELESTDSEQEINNV